MFGMRTAASKREITAERECIVVTVNEDGIILKANMNRVQDREDSLVAIPSRCSRDMSPEEVTTPLTTTTTATEESLLSPIPPPLK